MTKSLTEQYKKGYTPPALQRKYGLTYVQGYELAQEFKKLEQQLAIATKALKEYANRKNWLSCGFVDSSSSFADDDLANQALKEIKEVK